MTYALGSDGKFLCGNYTKHLVSALVDKSGSCFTPPGVGTAFRQVSVRLDRRGASSVRPAADGEVSWPGRNVLRWARGTWGPWGTAGAITATPSGVQRPHLKMRLHHGTHGAVVCERKGLTKRCAANSLLLNQIEWSS